MAEEGDTLVAVEVKTRRSAGYGLPQEAVDVRKRRKLRALLEAFCLATRPAHVGRRIDVVAVRLDGRLRVVSIEHLRHAVGDDD